MVLVLPTSMASSMARLLGQGSEIYLGRRERDPARRGRQHQRAGRVDCVKTAVERAIRQSGSDPLAKTRRVFEPGCAQGGEAFGCQLRLPCGHRWGEQVEEVLGQERNARS